MFSVKHEMKYRPDIDALRAVAVLSVVLYHFSKDWLPGGFVGVDIFFVISGYLITGILVKGVEKNTLSLSGFYLRRVRRILPATIFCVLTTTFFGTLFFIPTDGLSLAKSALAALLSFSNIFFWKSIDTSYFASSSDTLPLLHTWSLGVEEQFYIVWPLIIIAFSKFRKLKWLGVIAVVIAALSFYIGNHFITIDQSFSYYMLPARAGELLMGALAYICSKKIDRLNMHFAHLLSFFGILLVAFSLYYYNKDMGFPGFDAIIPTLGASLYIIGGINTGNLINKTLSAKPIVFIGLISFSLYLWHWPILAFARYTYTELDFEISIYCGFLIIFMTLLSYYFIEIPFRKESNGKLKYSLISIGFVIAAGISLFVINNNGALDVDGAKSYAKKMSELKPETLPAYMYRYNCQMSVYDDSVYNESRCTVGTSNKPSLIAVGDSNVAHYVGYLKAVSQSFGGSFKNLSLSSCVPFSVDVIKSYVNPKVLGDCVTYNKKIRSHVKSDKYKTVFIGATWDTYYRMAGKDKFIADFSNMLSDFSGDNRKVIIASKVPIFSGYDLKCQEKSIRMPFINCGRREGYKSQNDIEVNNIIRDLVAKNKSVQFFSVRNSICKAGFCSPYAGNKALYYDAGHLSMEGSVFLGNESVLKKTTPKYLTDALR